MKNGEIIDNDLKTYIEKISSLDNIHQWEERDSVIKESVSQHSFKVSAVCLFALEKIENEAKIKDSSWLKFKYECLKYAVLHDFDESILGRDISHTVKYNKQNGEKIRKELNWFVNCQIEELNLDFLFNADDDVRMFVKMCDWIALYSFIVRNENMGVKTFKTEKQYCLQNIKSFIEKVSKFLENKYKLHLNYDKGNY